MATTIKLKNSVSASVVPVSLEQGEVAVNITDKKVWVGNASESPVLISDYNQVVNLLDTPVTITGDASGGSELRFPEDTDNGSNYVALKAANSIASNVTFTLPNADGTNGQLLRTNGSGTLSFTDPGAGSFTLLATATASTSANVEFSGYFTSGYDIYLVTCTDAKFAGDDKNLNFYAGDGSGYYTTSSYGYGGVCVAEDADIGTQRSENSNGIQMNGIWTIGGATNERFGFYFYVLNPRASSAQKQFSFVTTYSKTNGKIAQCATSGCLNIGTTTAAITKIKFQSHDGTDIAQGTFRLYGYVNS